MVYRIDKNSALPYYYQLADIIKDEVAAGVYDGDGLIPSERELCLAYGLSRSTVRQAVQILKDEGLVEKVRGVGTRIIHREKFEQDLLGYHDFDLQMTEKGYKASVKVLSYDEMTGPSRIQSLLKAAQNARILKVVRLRNIQDEPLFIEKIYLPLTIFPDIRKEHFNSTNIFLQVIQKDYNIRLGETHVYLEPVILDEVEAGLLNVKLRPAAGLLMERVSCSERGEPVSVTKRVFRGDRCRHILDIKPK